VCGYDRCEGNCSSSSTDHPTNHVAFPILKVFPETGGKAAEERKALLWRVMFAYGRVMMDARFQEDRREENGQTLTAKTILEALATTPMGVGREIPIEEILRRAEELRRAEDD
jgi:hypothetical protein